VLVLPAKRYPTFAVIRVFFGQGLLGDDVEPVVLQSRTELLAGVSGWELNIEAGCEGWSSGAFGFLMEPPLESQVGVSEAAGRRASWSSVDGEIGDVHIYFQVVGQAIVELEVGCVLIEIRVLQLKSVVLVEELEVQLARLSDPGVVGVEQQLGVERFADAKQAGQS